ESRNGGTPGVSCPDHAVMIFKQGSEASLFYQDFELSAVPLSEARPGSDPKTPVASAQKAIDALIGKTAAGRRRPADKSHAVEPEEPGLRADPQVSIGCLAQAQKCGRHLSFLSAPSRVGVLRDCLAGVQG